MQCAHVLGWRTEKGGDVCRAQKLLREMWILGGEPSWRHRGDATSLEKLLKAEQGGETPGLLLFFLFFFVSVSSFFKITFYWNIVAIQYCVSFYHTAKCISHTYTYIPSLLAFLLIQVSTEH